jgi:D-arabinose 1-dehydrogenase-like Zn-dependent alcohol dehydrogenase
MFQIMRSLSNICQIPITQYTSLLRTDGAFVQIGAPEDGALQIAAHSLISHRINIGGSLIGSPSELREMLQLAAEKGVHPWINERPMNDANQTIVDMEAGMARYRYVLVNN